ncbi:hypothetical protein [Klebsiella pneumoniae]|uniref:hypothetical protein n=1 Tax=Klebsiella pneumoniae TaxID=573 RepID=UPI003F792A6A|nr:hypothetical protein [Klebsiella pneumoniae]
MFAGKKSAQIREILISESAWEEMTCLFAPSLAVVLLLVAVGSLMSYIKERRGYKKLSKKDINGYPLFKKQG